MSLHNIAHGYVEAGLSVIPVKADGTKSPLLNGWREFSTRHPTSAELAKWFRPGAAVGVGIPCGPASMNLAVLDFESGPVWDRWRAALPADDAAPLAMCPIVRTPSGGVHVWVRLPDPVSGTVLARFGNKGVAIEVRGAGHQVLAPGCPASCHPTGRTYEFEQRGWLDDPGAPLTEFDVWFRWLELAASLTEYKQPDPPKADPRPDRERTDGDPGSDFNRRGTWEQSGLFDAGWKWERHAEGDRGFLCRPGKTSGVSATVGMVSSAAHGWPLYFAFTSNCDPFDQGRGYDRFGVFARLKHGGDFKAATKALAGMGYGEQSKRPAARVNPIKGGCQVGDNGTAVLIGTDGSACEPAKVPTGAELILEYFRDRYRPVFRRGNAVVCEDGDTLLMATACAACTSGFIEVLATARNAPRLRSGDVNHDGLPGFFRKWAGVAWADMVATLPNEETAELGKNAPAREEFVRLVREALLSEVSLGEKDEGNRAQLERRSLIDWCQKFAKPGRWMSIRSKRCWCYCSRRDGGEIVLHVAIRHELFSQLQADRRLREMGSNRFARLAAKYGVGRAGGRDDRPGGQYAFVLDDGFVSSLTGDAPREE